MQRLMLAIIMVLFSINCYANDFRNTSWGMSKQQVKSAEKKKPLFDSFSDMVTYDTKIANTRVIINFNLKNDSLYKISYNLHKDTPENKKTAYCNNIYDFLIKQHGQPFKQKNDNKSRFVYWKNTRSAIIYQQNIISNNTCDVNYTDLTYWNEKDGLLSGM